MPAVAPKGLRKLLRGEIVAHKTARHLFEEG